MQVIGRYQYRLFQWGIEKLYHLPWDANIYTGISNFDSIFLLNIECTCSSFMNIKLWLGGMLASPLGTYYSSVWK